MHFKRHAYNVHGVSDRYLLTRPPFAILQPTMRAQTCIDEDGDPTLSSTGKYVSIRRAGRTFCVKRIALDDGIEKIINTI